MAKRRLPEVGWPPRLNFQMRVSGSHRHLEAGEELAGRLKAGALELDLDSGARGAGGDDDIHVVVVDGGGPAGEGAAVFDRDGGVRVGKGGIAAAPLP